MPASLAGRLLVASPTLDEATFHRTVIAMLAHSAQGALGVVVNRPTEVALAEALPGWEAVASDPAVVFSGGPVERTSIICLGEVEPGTPVDQIVDGIVTVDLSAPPGVVPAGAGRVRVFAGYAGWGSGQLEGELDRGSWLVVDGSPADVFGADADGLWRQVLRRAGGRAALYARAPEHLWLN